MPSLKFTQDAIESLKPPETGREYYWDETTPGFGLRISGTGKKTWVASYRVNGRAVMETVAPVSDLPSLKEARDRAQKSRMSARDGINPVQVKLARIKAEQGPDTFAEIYQRYVKQYCRVNQRASTLLETQRAFEHDLLPTLGRIPLINITKADLRTLLNKKASTAGVQANRNLARLKSMFNWCVKQELMPMNPAAIIDYRGWRESLGFLRRSTWMTC